MNLLFWVNVSGLLSLLCQNILLNALDTNFHTPMWHFVKRYLFFTTRGYLSLANPHVKVTPFSSWWHLCPQPKDAPCSGEKWPTYTRWLILTVIRSFWYKLQWRSCVLPAGLNIHFLSCCYFARPPCWRWCWLTRETSTGAHLMPSLIFVCHFDARGWMGG